MLNFFKYLPSSSKDESWGLSVLNTGCTRIEKERCYPPESHPAHHQFTWEKGRVLQEYQLIYIASGSGVFESSASAQQVVGEGSLILLFPGISHRYKPDKATGWDEYWVGFKGEIVENLIQQNFFSPADAVFTIGFNESVMNVYQDIIRVAREEKPGYQPLLSGAILYLLGHLYSSKQQLTQTETDQVEVTVSKARTLFRSMIFEDASPEKVASELNVGYSWFRKIFKKYTGLAPGQYLIQLKIQTAKELLANPNKQIKEIAFELQFESPMYFTKLFKDKVGITPAQYREQVLNRQPF